MTELLAQLQNGKFSTKKQLALDSGLSRQYIGLLAKGKRSPSLKTLCDISDALECSLVDLTEKLQEIMQEKALTQMAADNALGKQYIKTALQKKATPKSKT